MSVGIDSRRLCEWLVFCQKNGSEQGEIAFDETGMIWPSTKPNHTLPLDAPSRWTYFEYARDNDLLKSWSGTGQNYYRLMLSDRGKTFIAENHKSWIKVQLFRLKENAITILVAVLSALAVQWVISILGPSSN